MPEFRFTEGVGWEILSPDGVWVSVARELPHLLPILSNFNNIVEVRGRLFFETPDGKRRVAAEVLWENMLRVNEEQTAGEAGAAEAAGPGTGPPADRPWWWEDWMGEYPPMTTEERYNTETGKLEQVPVPDLAYFEAMRKSAGMREEEPAEEKGFGSPPEAEEHRRRMEEITGRAHEIYWDGSRYRVREAAAAQEEEAFGGFASEEEAQARADEFGPEYEPEYNPSTDTWIVRRKEEEVGPRSLNEYIEQALISGDFDRAMAADDFRNAPTLTDAISLASRLARNTQEFLEVIGILQEYRRGLLEAMMGAFGSEMATEQEAAEEPAKLAITGEPTGPDGVPQPEGEAAPGTGGSFGGGVPDESVPAEDVPGAGLELPIGFQGPGKGFFGGGVPVGFEGTPSGFDQRIGGRRITPSQVAALAALRGFGGPAAALPTQAGAMPGFGGQMQQMSQIAPRPGEQPPPEFEPPPAEYFEPPPPKYQVPPEGTSPGAPPTYPGLPGFAPPGTTAPSTQRQKKRGFTPWTETPGFKRLMELALRGPARTPAVPVTRMRAFRR